MLRGGWAFPPVVGRLVTRSPVLAFQETGQAFMDMNSSFVLRLNMGSGCFSVRFLVKQVAEPNKHILKGG
jgi:hypothetical protein